MNGIDFDSAMQALSQIAFGTGARILVVMICAYWAFTGLTSQRHGHVLTAILAAVAYFGMGVFLGKIGIA